MAFTLSLAQEVKMKWANIFRDIENNEEIKVEGIYKGKG